MTSDQLALQVKCRQMQDYEFWLWQLDEQSRLAHVL